MKHIKNDLILLIAFCIGAIMISTALINGMGDIPTVKPTVGLFCWVYGVGILFVRCIKPWEV